jgi:hypothetical protein
MAKPKEAPDRRGVRTPISVETVGVSFFTTGSTTSDGRMGNVQDFRKLVVYVLTEDPARAIQMVKEMGYAQAIKRHTRNEFLQKCRIVISHNDTKSCQVRSSHEFDNQLDRNGNYSNLGGEEERVMTQSKRVEKTNSVPSI